MTIRFASKSLFPFIIFFLFLSLSCHDSPDNTSMSQGAWPTDTSGRKAPRFESVPAEKTGVAFNNLLDINVLKSPLDNINVYNGGGVATGDINNDGLPDLFFTGNLVSNKLYLNKGNFQFEDISEKAGVTTAETWSSGVTMADVNGDGLLDIYVCRAYYEDAAKRENLLYINNGDLTFSEQAKKYGINDPGYSIVATFLDYDKDGRADLFVGNHPINRFVSFGEHITNWKDPKPEWSDKLYHNNGNGSFTDVTQKAGLLNYGWTLGVVAADLNQDGWTDIFVAVDHTEPDRYYLNNKNGTFSEVSSQKMKHMSHSSMGIDAADINNDGLLDLAVVEMLGTSNFMEKTKQAPTNVSLFWTLIEVGYQYQYTRNMLHLNAGNGEFSEIGQMAGIDRSNWSWASLLADFDNDGWKDYFVSNGYFREYLDQDHQKKFLQSLNEAQQRGAPIQSLRADYGKTAPSTKVENNFFLNNGDLTFTEKGRESGLNFLGFSSGAAYADLDNDGDLDLVVSNSNDPASIYKNLDRENGGNNYLRVQLQHPPNICPIGVTVSIETRSGKQFQEFTYTRGYQSSVEGMLHFGVAKNDTVDKLTITWLDGKVQELTRVPVNQVITLKYSDSGPSINRARTKLPTLFADISANSGVDFNHSELPFDDYKKQLLLPHKMSQFGPFISVGDVNNDQLEDFYIGGAKGQLAALYYQKPDGSYIKADIPVFGADINFEDMGAAFFDANKDGLLDLYVASGSNEDDPNSQLLMDRLYINVGKGVFQKPRNAIPDIRSCSSCVKPFDFDGDGDIDLFVGGRQIPGRYPSPASSILLENNNGFFKDVTAEKAPALQNLGMVTDAVWTDLNNDGTADLLITGEWMPLTVIIQKGGKFTNATAEFGLQNSVGWWNRIVSADIDNDGDLDFIVGNLGRNYRYKASPERPFHIYAGDFDNNDKFGIALGYYLDGTQLYPVRGLIGSAAQCPDIAEKFKSNAAYGKASLEAVYGKKLKGALHLEATNFASSVLLNMGGGRLELSALPNEAQIAPTNAIIAEDFDGDGNVDLLIGGNFYATEVETGRADAGRGLYLKGLGNGKFLPASFMQSGLHLTGDVKDIVRIKAGLPGERRLLVANNGGLVQYIKYLENNALR